ncbi:MAG: sodium:proton antiporter [Sphingomonadaceae bacterium]|nr:sodium:proton antiporter [Sphingomonadaceae bacterium]
MAGFSIANIGFVLLTASLVAIVSRRLRLPYSIGLVLAGIGLARLPVGVELPLTRDLIFSVFLPPLIFEAALQLGWPAFRRELPLTLVLAFVGVGVAAVVVAAGMHALLGWSWLGAAFFGVLIAATDPVSVIAAFKEMDAEPRLQMVVEAESLLNDGVAAVAFILLLGLAGGGSPSPVDALGTFAWTVAGGIGIGVGIAAALLALTGRTQDHLVELTLTTVVAWGSFLTADHLHASGVFATLAAGLMVGNVGWKGAISKEGRPHVVGFWEYAAFLANSCLFLLIGNHEAHQPIALLAGEVGLAVALTLAGRAVAVYPLAALFRWSSLRLPGTYQHVLVWGGLRGAIGLALALAVPASVPERQAIVVLTFGVVAFSIFVQGLTMPPLLKRWGLTGAGG